ncbi:hypothetical protein Q8A64_08490 [Oxalobacteraceae bacterium R-40]|uniref:DUF2645 family protein n=1 Tax=Keguizhuia sedimenti TaxID=3064264 RepID=A0ABU1BN55_9BURK|nr:hypothetical protein [Oxalobacteraceae bacterium R-40]
MQNPYKVQPLVKVMAAIWILCFASLAFIALIEQEITLGGSRSGGTSHSEGLEAVITGFVLIGLALLGFSPLIEYNRWKHQLRILAVVIWLSFCIGYLNFFYF